ncbi:muscle M-line assembly protein unc-89 [Spodoptera frugiperda]|uniref:Muscle M-line assembly protein unc-89 n=1 Tax=Spodoptera frugiperda TaxID=7108 RepID=A0A9R0EP48_SPOFR|nr:muscle M-line assembly protein unc-89 [Spodoptera frugiperda]
MSTRSGKRIHTSLLEDTVITKRELAVKSERKTRSRQVKEEAEELGVSLIKNKKRNNYVSYPTDDEFLGDTTTSKEDEAKTSRVLRKNALKEQNLVENVVPEPQTEVKNLIRKSRRGKKVDDAEETENHENIPTEIIDVPKSKKNKKKKKESDVNPLPEEVPSKKSKKKKKKGKKTNSMTAEDVPLHNNSKNGTHNGSNMSVDSFHSAAGSPNTEHNHIDTVPTNKVNNTFKKEQASKKSSKKNKKRSNNITEHSETSENLSKHITGDNINNSIDNDNKIRKSGAKDIDEGKHFIFTAKSERDNEDSSIVNNGQMKTRNSIITSDESNVSSSADIKTDARNNSRTKSKKNKSKSKKAHPVNTTKDDVGNDEVDKMEPDSNKSLFKDGVDTNAETNLNASNISHSNRRSRRSNIKDSTFDKSTTLATQGETDMETCLNTSNNQSQLRKSLRRESTANTSIVNGSKSEKDMPDDVNTSNISSKQSRRKSNVKDTTFDKDSDKISNNITNSTFDKVEKQLDATYEKEDVTSANKKDSKVKVNTTYDKPIDTTFDKDSSTSFDAFKIGATTRKSSIKDSTFDKSNISKISFTKEDFGKDNIITSSATKRTSIRRHTFDKNNSFTVNAINTTYEKTSNTESPLKRKSPRRTKSMDVETQLNTTFEKDTEVEHGNKDPEPKSSLISSDNSSVADKSEISRISITSDESEHVENIVNTTPLLIESSLDESQHSMTKAESPKSHTPLKREGTFTKESPQKQDTETSTPTKRRSSIVPAAGCTPYHVTKSNQKKSMLNVTRSIEKGVRASVEPAPRLTRVMFCSPVDNPVLVAQERKKIIKSNLKGSNKSFVYEESVPAPTSRAGRKRSYTQNDADDTRVKRSRLTEDLQQSVDRLSRPRTASATAKLTSTTPKKAITPSKPKSDAKVSRTKLPNFAALHQKQFDKMESLNECQERRAKRARQLLTPTAPAGLLERISPKNNVESPKGKDAVKPKEKTDTPTKKTDTPTKKTDTPTKKLPTLESLRPGFTRFGFKLNLDVNPFSIPSKTEKPKEKVIEKPNGGIPKAILPSLAGATSVRREAAKQTVMREKSFTEKRSVKRNENRSIIKGVRTNRRFELQMKMRNIE